MTSPSSVPSNDASRVISSSPLFDLQPDQLQPDRAVAERYETRGLHMEAQVRRLEMAAFTEQRAPPHVERHPMRRHIARMMQQGTAGQQDAYT